MTAVLMTFPVDGLAAAWAALSDPARLAASLPGCTRAVAAPGGGVRLDVDVAVVSVRGRWTGTAVAVAADDEAVRVAGAGDVGAIDVVVRIDPARTQLTVEGAVEGPLAAIGAGLLAAGMRRTATDLLAALAAPAPTPRFSHLDRLSEQPIQVQEPEGGGGGRLVGRAPGVAGVSGVAVAAGVGLAVGVVIGRRRPGTR